jgi:holo-[acyl-carrier protein] synthase
MTDISPGIDIVDIEKFKKLLELHNKKFLTRVFNEQEIKYCYSRKKPEIHLAARFAAKEAVKKSYGYFGIFIKFADIIVKNRDDGYPEIDKEKLIKYLPGGGEFDIMISISHTDNLACAISILKIYNTNSNH